MRGDVLVTLMGLRCRAVGDAVRSGMWCGQDGLTETSLDASSSAYQSRSAARSTTDHQRASLGRWAPDAAVAAKVLATARVVRPRRRHGGRESP
jgi:hypothetical protein